VTRHPALANAPLSAARSVPSAQLIFTVILVQQMSVLSLIAGSTVVKESWLRTALRQPMVFLDPVSKVEELQTKPPYLL